MEYFTLLTKAGLAAIADAIRNQTTVNITEMAFGDANGNAYEPGIDQEHLINEKYRIAVNSITPDQYNPNWLIVEAILPSDVGNFYIQEVGLYADGTLIAVSNYPRTYKPVVSDGILREMTIHLVIQVENADAVNMEIDPNISLATRQYVNDQINQITVQGIKPFETYADLLAYDDTPPNLAKNQFIARVTFDLNTTKNGLYAYTNGQWRSINDSFIDDFNNRFKQLSDSILRSISSGSDVIFKVPYVPDRIGVLDTKPHLRIFENQSLIGLLDGNGKIKLDMSFLNGVVPEKNNLNVVSLPKLPGVTENTFEVYGISGNRIFKAAEDGSLEISGKNFRTNKIFNAPNVPDAGNSIELYSPSGVRLLKIDPTGEDNTEITGLDSAKMKLIQIPSLPEEEQDFEVFGKDGPIFGITRRGKLLIHGEEVKLDNQVNQSKFKSWYSDGIKTFITDEKSSTEVLAKPSYNHQPISNDTCIAVVEAPDWAVQQPIQMAMNKDGYIFPNPHRVLVIIPFFGQSLSNGSGGVPIYTTPDKNPYPEYVFKFKGYSTTFDRSGGSGQIAIIQESQLTDLEPLFAVDRGNSYSGETICEQMCIQVATELDRTGNSTIRILSFAAGVGGTVLNPYDFPSSIPNPEEYKGLLRGSDGYITLMNALKAATRIAASKGWSVIVPRIGWQHGEGDRSNLQYKNSVELLMTQLNEDIPAITGQTIPVGMYAANCSNMTTLNGFRSSQAIYELSRDQPEKYTQVGGVYECQPRAEFDDWTHITTRGYTLLGYKYAQAILHDLKHGFGSYRAVRPKTINRIDNEIFIEFFVPEPPLRWHTNDVILPIANGGFSYVDDSNSASISNVEIQPDGITLKITLSAIPTGANKKIRAAYNFEGGTATYAKRQRTNLCDSTPGKTPLGDDLARFCLTFEEVIN